MPPDGELYIRFSASDDGERDIPPGTVWWLSPAIEIINGFDSSTAQADDLDQAIRVKVGNQGANTRTDVTVQVYAADWGTANPWLQSLGGTAGVAGGPFTVVGNADIGPPDTEGVIDIGWTPAASELGGLSEKHVCLFANAHRPGDGAPQSDPPSFSIPTNQHHAQRNIKLRPAASGGGMFFGFHAANLAERGARFVLEIAPVKTRRLAPFETRHLRSADWLTAAQKELGGERLGPVPAPERPALVLGGKRGGSKLEVELDGGQQVPLAIDAGKAPKEPGIQRFDIVQRAARTGDVVGGARLLVAVLPGGAFPKRLRRDPDLRED